MKNERRKHNLPNAAALTESNLEAIGLEDDATAPVPSTNRNRSEIIAASDRLKRIDPRTNVVVSLGERETEQGLELKVYHRVDDKVGTSFTAMIGYEGTGYAQAGRYFADQMLTRSVHSYTIVSDVPVATDGNNYEPLGNDKVALFKRALDDRLTRR